MNSAILILGSNTAKAKTNIGLAVECLSQHLDIIRQTENVETTPVGEQYKNNFINCAVLLSTDENFQIIKRITKYCETKLGRTPEDKKKWSNTNRHRYYRL